MGTSEPASPTDPVETLRLLLHGIGRLRDSDPGLALVEARRAAEALCNMVWQQLEGAEFPSQLRLDRMIAQLEQSKRVPRPVSVSLRTIQHFGNIGAHASGADLTAITSLDIGPCLQALANVVGWYSEAFAHDEKVRFSPINSTLNSMSRAELERKTRLDRLSLSLSLDTDDAIIDFAHCYDSIKRIDVLDYLSGDYKSYRWLEITNASTMPSLMIPHLESGENKIRHTAMRVRANVGSIDGNPMAVRDSSPQQPSFSQRFHIDFPTPLPPAESMRIHYRLRWPGEVLTYSDDEQSQGISLARYWRGVNRLTFGVLSTRAIASAYACKITHNYSQNVSGESLRPFVAEDEMELTPIHGQDLRGVLLEVDKPDALAYRIIYRLGMASNTEDTDDF